MYGSDAENIRRLMICVNRMDGIYYRLAREIGMKDNTLSLYYALSDGKPHSQKEICEEWLIPRTTINTIVRECVEQGYVRLEKEMHGKEKQLLLTDCGRHRVNSLMKDLFVLERAAFDSTVEQYGSEFVCAFHYFTDQLERSIFHHENESE